MKLSTRNAQGGSAEWWAKFNHDVDARWVGTPDMWLDVRRALLTEWNCKMVWEGVSNDSPHGELMFESDEDLTLFLLRWA